MFGRADFQALATQLAGLEGRFILSMNDTPEIRRTFAAFSIEAIETAYTLAGSHKPKKAAELIITGNSRR